MRKALNSGSLRKENKTLYRSFFANYDLVVSSPGGAILAGTFTDHVGGPALHQKIPLRNYLGVSIIDGDAINFENYGTFDYYTEQFVRLDLKREYIDKIKALQKKTSDYLGRKVGLKVGILNEIPRRTGLNNPGTNASNLTATFLLLSGQLKPKGLSMFQDDLFLVEEKTRKKIIETAKEFHAMWLGRKSSGFGVLANMVNRPDILVYNPESEKPVLAINDIFQPEVPNDLPFDVVIVGTSDRYDIDFSLRKYDEVENIFSITDADVLRLEKAFCLDNKTKDGFPVALRKSYYSAVNVTGLATVIAVGKFIENPNMENQKMCLQLLNSSYDIINLFGQNFIRKDKVHSLIKKYFHEVLADMPFAITTGITNNLLLVTPRESVRDTLPGLEKYLKSRLNFDISFPFISWTDENDAEGVVIEKWCEYNLSPSYVPKNCLYLYTIRPQEMIPEVIAIDNRELLENDFDILFDEDDKKIYIKGVKVTSRELPTVAATISLFGQLMISDNFVVKSDDLPNQSYFLDRNELQSKIISPLRIYVEKSLGKHLNLKINGRLSEFKVSIFPSDIKIGFIKRF